MALRDIIDSAKGIASEAIGEEGLDALKNLKNAAKDVGDTTKNRITRAINESDNAAVNKAKAFVAGVKQEKEGTSVNASTTPESNSVLTPAICSQCGAVLEVNQNLEAAVCQYCGTPFIVEKAINEYRVQNARILADKVEIHKKGTVESVLSYVDKRREEKKAEEQRMREEEERREREAAKKRKEAAEKRRAFLVKYRKVFAGIMAVICIAVAVMWIAYAKSTAEMIKAGHSAYSLEDKNYNDVVTMLEVSGFSHIETEPMNDIVFGIFNTEGAVEEVSIDGNTTFSGGTKFDPDAKVVVRYHSSVSSSSSTGESPVTEEATPTESASLYEANEAAKPVKNHASYHSSGDKDVAKNGNSGIYAYCESYTYDNYYIIDFDEGYVYTFADGNGSGLCFRLKIESGDLNDVVIITYHDGDDTWSEGLHFNFVRQPDTMIVQQEDGWENTYRFTDLEDALALRDTKQIIDY